MLTSGRFAGAALLACSLIPAAARAEPAGGASFDCRKAAAEAEKTVCADPKLAQLDRNLANLWKSYLSAFEDEHQMLKALRGEQSAWLARRNACKSDGACVAAAYAKRYELLSGKLAERPFAGIHESPSGTMAVFPANDGTYLVSIMTSDVNGGSWNCEVFGAGTASGNSLALGVDKKYRLAVSRDRGALKIDESEATGAVERSYCGLNGSITFTYR